MGKQVSIPVGTEPAAYPRPGPALRPGHCREARPVPLPRESSDDRHGR
jgi:hypothetical protein